MKVWLVVGTVSHIHREVVLVMIRLSTAIAIERGKLAVLLVLTEDLGQSTSAFRSITHVMKNGVLREISLFAGR